MLSFCTETPYSLLVIYQRDTSFAYEEYFLYNEHVNHAPAWRIKSGEKYISRSSASGKWQIGTTSDYVESEIEYTTPFEEGIAWDISNLEDVDDILVTRDGKKISL